MGGGVWTVILRIYFLNRKSPLLLTQNASRIYKKTFQLVFIKSVVKVFMHCGKIKIADTIPDFRVFLDLSVLHDNRRVILFPYRVQVYTEWNERQAADIIKDTQVRYQGGIKSEILTDVAVNGCADFRTDDGIRRRIYKKTFQLVFIKSVVKVFMHYRICGE